jgi:mitochondrial import inner membrane translocase subunit TIM16
MANATSGSTTDQMTRTHRITLDEAHLILNVKQGEPMERIMQVREPSHASPARADPHPRSNTSTS